MNISMPSVALTSVAVCDQARGLDKARVIRRITSLSAEDMFALEEAMRIVHGL